MCNINKFELIDVSILSVTILVNYSLTYAILFVRLKKTC